MTDFDKETQSLIEVSENLAKNIRALRLQYENEPSTEKRKVLENTINAIYKNIEKSCETVLKEVI